MRIEPPQFWRFLSVITACVAVARGIYAQPPEPPTEPAPSPAAPTPSAQTPSKPAELGEAVVLLRDGQRYTGLLVSQDENQVVLRIAGIDTPIPASRIDRLTVLAPVLERYRAMRETIDDQDVESLLRLVEWLRARSQWDPAIKELDHIQKIQPDNPEARKLRILVLSQKKLVERPRDPAKPPAGQRQPVAPEAAEFPVLGEADINLIKVYEINLGDPPRLLIRRETIRRLLDEHPGDPALPVSQEQRDALYRASPVQILEAMFKAQARNLYAEVQVLDQPRSMLRFRDDVHRGWLINSCATAACHGGNEAGRLKLNPKRGSGDPIVYTNFLILERFRLADGRALINYDDPAASPLLQLGLPRPGPGLGHPIVPAKEGHGDLWRPFFRSEDDRRFQAAVGWIKSMYRPRPEYPVKYSPPGPSTAPPKVEAPPVPR